MGDRTTDVLYLFYLYWRIVGDRKFDTLYLFLIYWTIVETEHLMRFNLFYIYRTIVGDRTFHGFLPILHILDNCGGPNV